MAVTDMALRVVYVKEFGHVVGALSTVDESPQLEVASLVGAELPLRTSLDLGRTATLAVKADRLAAAVVDDESAVFDQTLLFGVELTADGKPKPTLRRLATWDEIPELKEDSLTITLPANAVNRTPVLALVTDGQDIRILAGDIPAGDLTVNFEAAFSKGMHGLLVLVPGMAGLLMAVSVA
jgi:hypothetical protein